MPNNVLMLSFFVALGIGWRLVVPHGVNAATLQRPLLALARLAILPIAVFFTLSRLPMDEAAARILFYVILTTAIALAAAWFWLSKTRLQPKAKGALLIAAAFGNVLFVGLPLNKALLPDWTMRVAIEYGLVANLLLLFTVGAALARSVAEGGKVRFNKIMKDALGDRAFWQKEPMVWAAVAGLIVNLVDIKLPGWFGTVEAANYGLLIPLSVLLTALSLNWNKAWQTQLTNVAPAAAIQLILVPLVMWGAISLIGSPGAKGAQALMLNSMMPAALFGLLAVERYKLDSETYSLVFSLTTALALITVPIWLQIL